MSFINELIFPYEESCYIPSCEPGGDEVQIGEILEVKIEPVNPLWPETMQVCVERVQQGDPYGRIYTLSYDADDLNGGPEIRACDIIGIDCPDCCVAEQLFGPLDCSPLD